MTEDPALRWTGSDKGMDVGMELEPSMVRKIHCSRNEHLTLNCSSMFHTFFYGTIVYMYIQITVYIFVIKYYIYKMGHIYLKNIPMKDSYSPNIYNIEMYSKPLQHFSGHDDLHD